MEVYCNTLSKPKKGTIYSIHDSDFRGELEWKLESNEFRLFYRQKLNFKIYKKKVLPSLLGEFSLDLNKLENKTKTIKTI